MHYFKETESKKNHKIIKYQNLEFKTHSNIFSHNHIDYATDLLLSKLQLRSNSKVLDLGCGYGIIGIYTKRFNVDVTMSDVNNDAVLLTQENCILNNIKADVLKSDVYENITTKFDYIITNPPIHAGKDVVQEILFKAVDFLLENGELIFVMNKKHGLKSTLKHIDSIYSSYEVIGKLKDFKVIKAIK